MGSHPLNLLLRFLLELAALTALGYWGWQQADGALAYMWAIGLPVVTAVLWATFAVPNDPSRSGKAPVPVPGLLRLLLELLVFGTAVAALYSAGARLPGLLLGGITAIHYGLSVDRLKWLIRQ
ncbi:MAG: YrdB family protein [Ardenticatenaceae bacterium]|nr:YrdB family protein [Anaerolineales bacterium]MCB8923946.1 YrdB family protein [Ardenticatenaceae bacterium]MCB9005460.1 YrdB family protein [Ardenticatenaceae bacterium]